MKPAPKPDNEAARLEALKHYRLLDSLPEEVYNEITRIASEICGTPIAMLNLIDAERQWTKANTGIVAREMPRDQAFCAHTILNQEEVMVIEDARYDERFHDNPFVIGEPGVVFYAGVPIRNKEGYAFGSLCVVDSRARELSDQKLEALKALGKLVQTNFELRFALMEREENRHWAQTAMPLVNKIMNGMDVLENTGSGSLPAEQLNSLREDLRAFRTLLEQSAHFRKDNPV
jgi:hypothetical protein